METKTRMTLNATAASSRQTDPFWYNKPSLDKDGNDLFAGVTDGKSNPDIGILNISVYELKNAKGEPLQGMIDKGGICKVSLDTTTAYIDGITVWNSQNNDGSIYLQLQGREYTDKEGKKKYARDTRLKRTVHAQVLRYVSTMLKSEPVYDTPQGETEE